MVHELTLLHPLPVLANDPMFINISQARLNQFMSVLDKADDYGEWLIVTGSDSLPKFMRVTAHATLHLKNPGPAAGLH